MTAYFAAPRRAGQLLDAKILIAVFRHPHRHALPQFFALPQRLQFKLAKLELFFRV
jgi:hypothetical protein